MNPFAPLSANPTLVGAVTVLVVVLAVFLSYNANQGLPFVPTRTLNVLLVGGANLTRGNDVRSGGFRIGVLQALEPVRLPTGRVGALLTLKLDEQFGHIPVDTRVKVRARSALGLKYLEITKGRSPRMVANGGTLALSQSSVPVELDEFFNIFDTRTRQAAQENLRSFGDALAGRGADLNRFVADSPELTLRLRRVAATLNDPRTRLPRLFRELEHAARTVLPVSKIQARMFTGMADTFGALSRDRRALGETIAKGPSTEDVVTRSLRVQRPFLNDLARVSADLRGATAELRVALPPVNRALAVGTPVSRRSPALSDRLARALVALRDLARAPTTPGALRGLTATVTTLQPQLRYVGPFVTVCNYWNTFWTFVAEHFSAPDETGGTQRVMTNDGARQDDAVDQMGVNEFVHGHGTVPGVNGGRPQHIHNDTYGAKAIDDHGNASCEPGQAGYLSRGNHFAADQATYGHAVVDPSWMFHDRYPTFPPLGSTYARYDKQGHGFGRNADRVPAGQTFTGRAGGLGVEP